MKAHGIYVYMQPLIFEKMLPRPIIALDVGERVLIVPFLRKSLSRVLWTSPSGIGRHFGLAG